MHAIAFIGLLQMEDSAVSQAKAQPKDRGSERALIKSICERLLPSQRLPMMRSRLGSRQMSTAENDGYGSGYGGGGGYGDGDGYGDGSG